MVCACRGVFVWVSDFLCVCCVCVWCVCVCVCVACIYVCV